MVRKMSSTAGPDLNWPLVRSAGTIGEAEIVLQPGGLLAVALSALTVALPAFRDLPNLLAAIDDLLRRGGRLSDVATEGPAAPRRRTHRALAGSDRSTASSYLMYWMTASRSLSGSSYQAGIAVPRTPRVIVREQVAVRRQRLLGQPELEHGGVEVARALVEHEGRRGPVAVAGHAVAAEAAPLVDFLAVGDPFLRARERRDRSPRAAAARTGRATCRGSCRASGHRRRAPRDPPSRRRSGRHRP